MSNNNHAGAGMTAAALATGTLVGLTVGLLYAPKSGEENRRDLINNYNATKSRMRFRTGQFKEALKSKTGNQQVDDLEIIDENNAKLLDKQNGQDEI